MDYQPEISAFIRSWTYLRGMTTDFIEAVPSAFWDFSPGAKYGPLSKQFRHMVWVSDLYRCALKNGKMDMAAKKKSYEGSTDKATLVAALKERDAKLAEMLRDEKYGSDTYRVDFFGTPMTFTEFTHVMTQHEALHHGMWSMYAAQAGFETPKSWKDDWEL